MILAFSWNHRSTTYSIRSGPDVVVYAGYGGYGGYGADGAVR